MHNLLQVVEWSNQNFLSPGLQVYGQAGYALAYHFFLQETKSKNWGQKFHTDGSPTRLIPQTI